MMKASSPSRHADTRCHQQTEEKPWAVVGQRLDPGVLAVRIRRFLDRNRGGLAYSLLRRRLGSDNSWNTHAKDHEPHGKQA